MRPQNELQPALEITDVADVIQWHYVVEVAGVGGLLQLPLNFFYRLLRLCSYGAILAVYASLYDIVKQAGRNELRSLRRLLSPKEGDPNVGERCGKLYFRSLV